MGQEEQPGDTAGGAPPPPPEQPLDRQALAAAQALLETNAALVFKLNGESRAGLSQCALRPKPADCVPPKRVPPARPGPRTCPAARPAAGLALLRHRAAAAARPLPVSAEERALLEQAQACLQEAAVLLPPKASACCWAGGLLEPCHWAVRHWA